MSRLLFALLVSIVAVQIGAFAPPPSLGVRRAASPIMMAGFGGDSKKGGKKKQKNKEPKLKPKTQWDRYAALKTATMVKVAVRTSEEGEWFEVGRIKSKDNAMTEIAVAKQRVMIAEVRL